METNNSINSNCIAISVVLNFDSDLAQDFGYPSTACLFLKSGNDFKSVIKAIEDEIKQSHCFLDKSRIDIITKIIAINNDVTEITLKEIEGQIDQIVRNFMGRNESGYYI